MSDVVNEEVEQNTILNDIKILLNIGKDVEVFDAELILHINSVLSVFGQLWNTNGITKIDKASKWEDYFKERQFEAVKELLFLKVKLIFDPPQTSFGIAAYEKQIADLEYRLIVQGDIEDEKQEKD